MTRVVDISSGVDSKYNVMFSIQLTRNMANVGMQCTTLLMHSMQSITRAARVQYNTLPHKSQLAKASLSFFRHSRMSAGRSCRDGMCPD